MLDIDINSINGLVERDCFRFDPEGWSSQQDMLTSEISVQIGMPNGTPLSLLCFPDEIATLVRGHLLLDHCPQGMELKLSEVDSNCFEAEFSPCRKVSVTEKNVALPFLNPQEILELSREFIEKKGKWERTGCFHKAALYRPQTGCFAVWAEDIGRHNCIDRLAGWGLETSTDLSGLVLFVSARATASLVGKAVRAGVKIMISRSATTAGAIELAEKERLTLVGFSRKNRFTLYCDPDKRIKR